MGVFTAAIGALLAGQPVRASVTDTWHDALVAATDPWTSFTPTFTNLTIGNGSVTSSYVQVGKDVKYRGRLTWGSTTSATGSATLLSLPVTALDANCMGDAWLFGSTNANRQAAVCPVSGVTLLQFYSATGPVTGTTPFTWVSTNVLQWMITYEAA